MRTAADVLYYLRTRIDKPGTFRDGVFTARSIGLRAEIISGFLLKLTINDESLRFTIADPECYDQIDRELTKRGI